MSVSYYIPGKTFSSEQFSLALRKHLPFSGGPLTVLCIGTDLVPGDSLGPLIGYKLKKKMLPNLHVLGTLSQPVHAENLSDFCKKLSEHTPIIAIDAALGCKEHIGWITLEGESLKPGLGMKKDLPAVGQVSITGIVGDSGQDAVQALSQTRLSLVMELADCITEGIVRYCCSDIP